jgi:hypothetical protein
MPYQTPFVQFVQYSPINALLHSSTLHHEFMQLAFPSRSSWGYRRWKDLNEAQLVGIREVRLFSACVKFATLHLNREGAAKC